MKKHIFHDGHTRYERISKAQARYRFNASLPLYIIAHKMRPGRPFSMGMTVASGTAARWHDDGKTFDDFIREFCWHNATCHETGTYAAYYIETPLSIYSD